MLADPETTTGGLTAAEAAARSAVVSVRAYQVSLDLTELLETDAFDSRTVIEFEYDGVGGPGMTWVDLVAGHVASVVLDGTLLDPEEVVRGNRIRIGPLGGRHRLEVVARQRTDVPGRGLSRTVDNQDVYVWTQFQPFDARRVFACFDQPDLKATFAFTVRAPLEWSCVSNRLESSVIEDGDAAIWTFPPTVPLPTYATAVCAGPFHVVRSAGMALYARRSLAAPLERNAAELFALSRRGLELFEETFGLAYDGDSYDHVFLPDQAGAMENHGCVTWNDQVIYRSEPTAEQRRRRALVLLHEMAHMWFGNLVTPRWWDGLWLSESFADWAAVWASAELGVLDSRWSVAMALEKERAADADQLSSTHPVSRSVPDLAAAEANFDAITYAKGACMLRQLVDQVGEDAFLTGLREYFRLHAGGNGSLAALLAALQPFAAIDLAAWSREWLESSGINTLSLETTSEDGRYTSAVLVQSNPPRRHKVSIGDHLVEFTGTQTDVPALVGTPTADLLLLDAADTTYALLRPDDVHALVKTAPTLTDLVARTVARRTVRGLLRDGALSAADAVEYVARSLVTENDVTHLKALTTLGAEAVGPAHSESLERRLAGACLEALEVAKGDHWLVLVDALADFADELPLLDSLLADDLPQTIRWRLITRRVALGLADDTAAELARDHDPDARWYAAAARAAAPTPEAKSAALDLMLTAPGVPVAALRTFGQAFWQPRQSAVLAEFPMRFLDRLPGFGEQAGWPAAQRVALYAFPTVGITDAFLARALDLDVPLLLRRALSDQAEQAARRRVGSLS
ncbi:aminopeptidase N [Kribbella steppae]|uniref:Aminopeptidase N n=1 Tax=Kribbella steppae TaxID=2512223 RepID=A0A4R2HDV6_9ACTN|nr:aminopeptidase N [Kribbella steppae]TCO26204.1 aminopeptidase N [Kribbella steppae]